MIPIVTPEEMGAIDAAAPEPVEELIERAGAAVARHALTMLGGTYGRRVVVVAGKGNNGADGRAAARRLTRRGVRVDVLDAVDAVDAAVPAGGAWSRLASRADLLVDAAYGTGFRGSWEPPPVPAGVPVLAVDIPSGVSGLTGEVGGRPWRADRTVTFAALKPGLVLEPGASLAGEIVVADIGLDTSAAERWLLTALDVAAWLPTSAADTHKWKSAVWVIGGSPGLEGAAVLTARAAMRAGAGYVRVSSPGAVPSPKPVEAVGTTLPVEGWAGAVLEEASRFGAIVVGNGLGLAEHHGAEVRRLVAECPVPLVVDADGLTHLASGDPPGSSGPAGTTVLTPHDGEYGRLMGGRPGPDRFEAASALARRWRAVTLLKGPCTIVADPDGEHLASRAGDARLATLGSGDVLAGVIGAFLARGVPAPEAVGAAAVVHGMAGSLGWRTGLVAGDLPDLLPAVLDLFQER